MEKIGILFKATSMLLGEMILSALLLGFLFVICGQTVIEIRHAYRWFKRRRKN